MVQPSLMTARTPAAIGSSAQQAKNSKANSALQGANILLVEDEVLVAMGIEFALKDAGANVVGPAARLETAFEATEASSPIDAAILDVNLAGKTVYPLAEKLQDRNIPIVFHTGHGTVADLSAKFPEALVCAKPILMDDLLAKLIALLSTP